MSVADLEKLVVRLEAVTGKLESLPSRGSGGGASGPIGRLIFGLEILFI